MHRKQQRKFWVPLLLVGLGLILAISSTPTVAGGSSGDIMLPISAQDTLNTLWNATWGGASVDEAFDMDLDVEDNAYLVGRTYSMTGNNDIEVVKFNKFGVKLWNITWGGTDIERADGVAADYTGCYVVGETNSIGNGGADMFVHHYDTGGSLIWNITWGLTEDEAALAVEIDDNGDLLVTGYTDSYGEGYKDMVLLKLNPDTGALIWNTTFGGYDDDMGLDIAFTHDNSPVVFGQSASSGAGGYDALIAKFESTTGNLV